MAYIGKTPSQATRSRFYYTAIGGETSLSGADDNGNVLVFSDGNFVDVILNGVTLVAGTDYNTSTTNTISGLAALTASDVVEIVVYDVFSVFGGDVKGDFNVSNGSLTATRDSATPVVFNRTTSDGTILDLQKDGTTVGSISSTSGSLAINTGSAGGIYLGGTGAANYLDDYEEGTWTPSYISQSGSFTTLTYLNASGSYVKIGKVVHIQLRLRTNNVNTTGASNNLRIGGLPFTVENNSNTARNAVSISAVALWGGDSPDTGYAENNTTYIQLQYRTAANGGHSDLQVSDMTTGAVLGNALFLSATYTVD